MAIPQINSEQVSALTGMATGYGAISVVVPDAKLDGYDKYNTLTAELCDLNQLVILGLLKDITDQCGDKLATMYAMSNRHFRIFEITEVGRKMFDGINRSIQ
jgi:hypothetical protein